MTRITLALLPAVCLFPLACGSSDDLVGDPGMDVGYEQGMPVDGGASPVAGEGPPPPASGTGGSTGGGCAMMCEVEVITEVPGTGSCSAAAYVAGQGYPGGSTVSFEGSEYTSNSWTDISPAAGSGAVGSGSQWGPGMPCAGSGPTEVITKEMVCCGDEEPVVTPGSAGCALDSILGEAGFNKMFEARRDPFYTYKNLCTATKKFPAFAASGNVDTDKHELAAFFANVARETGELDYIEQIVKDPPTYFGRGPIQLTHDYNYKAAGDFLGVNLHATPDLVATDGVITWETALWFWMEADGAGKGTCHGAITGGLGFGQTINIINGGLECGASNPAAEERIAYFSEYCGDMGVTPGDKLTCW